MKIKLNQKIEKTAYAKINLFLEVGEKMPDGYHEITTVMHTVSLDDKIYVTVTSGDGIKVSTENCEELCGENNIAYKAAKLFLEKINYKCSVDIEISKKIPVAAGLGGGSCDSGAVLLALNDAFYNILSQKELETLAKKIGADVPFATHGGCVIARGIGDAMEDIAPLENCYVLIAKQGKKKSTKEVYEKLDLIKNRKQVNIEQFLEALNSKDISQIAKNLYNAFEKVVHIPNGVENILRNSEALGYTLCGAGPSVIAIFDDMERAKKTKQKFDRENIFCCIAEPMDRKASQKINNCHMSCN